MAAKEQEDWKEIMGLDLFEEDPLNPGQMKMKILTPALRKKMDELWDTNVQRWIMDNKVKLRLDGKSHILDEQERQEREKRSTNRTMKLNRKPLDRTMDPRLSKVLQEFPLDKVDRFRFHRAPKKKKTIPQMIAHQKLLTNKGLGYDLKLFGPFDSHKQNKRVRAERDRVMTEREKRLKHPWVNIWGKIAYLNKRRKVFTPKVVSGNDPLKKSPELMEHFSKQLYNPYGIPPNTSKMDWLWYNVLCPSNLLKSHPYQINAKDGEFKLKLLHQMLHKDLRMDKNHERIARPWINNLGKLYLFHDLRQFLRLNRFKQICSYRKCTRIVKRYEQYEYSIYRGDERLQVDQPNYFKGDDCQFWALGRWIDKQRRKLRKYPENWRTISWREISYHRFPNDCWTSVKDRVFDITDFLEKHPGGDIPLRQVFGKDGTWTFLGVHPYIVFYDKMAGFEIGRSPDFRPHHWTYFEPHYEWDGLDLFGYWLIKPKHPLSGYFPVVKYSCRKETFEYSVEFPRVDYTDEDHWMFSIFRKQNIIIRFYVKGSDMWLGNVLLPVKLVDPRPQWKFENDFTKLTLTFSRPSSGKTGTKLKELEDHGLFFNNYTFDEYYPAWIMQIAWLSNDRCLFTVGYNSPNFFGVPIGFHVNFKLVVSKRTTIIRPYTPICFPIVEDPKIPLKKRKPYEPGKLFFLIRIQNDGEMGSLLRECTGIPPGKRDYGFLYISAPRGNFEVSFMYDDMDVMLLIAGGTGISIFTRIIQDYMKNRKLIKDKTIILMYHCRKKKDHVFNKTFNWLAKETKWFHYFPLITKPDNMIKKDKRSAPSATGASLLKVPSKSNQKRSENMLNKGDLWGHPGPKQIKKVLSSVKGANDPDKKLKVMVCGPYLFTHWAALSLIKIEITDPKNIWFFQGASTYEELKKHQIV